MKKFPFNANWKEIGSGSYGTVYQMDSKKCIKIFDSECYSELSDVKKEFKNLKKFKKTGLVPRPYKLVKIDGIYSPNCYAIIMEYFPYLTIDEARDHFNADDVLDKAQDIFYKKTKHYYLDAHGSNIMVRLSKDGGKVLQYYFIDMGPNSISKGERNETY
jgi:hypothetical protein